MNINDFHELEDLLSMKTHVLRNKKNKKTRVFVRGSFSRRYFVDGANDRPSCDLLAMSRHRGWADHNKCDNKDLR